MSRPKPKAMAKQVLSGKQTESEYEVEKILDKKVVFGVTYYKVKWLGYMQITWEPAANLVDNNLSFGAAELVQEFEDNYVNNLLQSQHKNNETEPKVSKKCHINSDDNEMNQLTAFDQSLQTKKEEDKLCFNELPKAYFKAKQIQSDCKKKGNKKLKKKEQINEFEENLRTEPGSFSAGDTVDQILGMHAFVNDQGEKAFYCVIAWKPREDGTIPLQSHIKSSLLTKQNIELGNLYRKFVEEKYLAKYFLR